MSKKKKIKNKYIVDMNGIYKKDLNTIKKIHKRIFIKKI